MDKRIAITGIGPVTAAGIGAEIFFNNLLNNKVETKKIPDSYFEYYQFNSKYYVPLPEYNLAESGISIKHGRIMQKEDEMAILATHLAIKDAGLEKFEYSNDTCLVIGIGCRNFEASYKSYLAHISKYGSNGKLNNKEKYHYQRMIIPMTMPNSIAGWISIIFRIKGSSYTVNASCASGTMAIGEGYRKIKNGNYKIALVGGVENMHDETGSIMRGFDMLGVLTKSDDGRPIPFSTLRSGFLFSEGGACILILEELEHALKRDAKIYAEITDYCENSDSYNIVQMDPSGNQAKNIFTKLASGKSIDYINSHGTGTELNDEIESKVIKDVFGNMQAQPYINSTKGIIGHTIGASGAIEAAVTAISIKQSMVHKNILINPILNLNIPLENTTKKIEHAISVSFGFGGHNAGLLLKRYE